MNHLLRLSSARRPPAPSSGRTGPTNQIRSAIEAERERTFALLTEVLVRIQKDMIPEVVATLPALRGPAGPVGPAGKLPIVEEWTRETVSTKAPSSPTMAAAYQALRDTGEPPDNEAHWQLSRSSWSRCQVDPPPWHVQR